MELPLLSWSKRGLGCTARSAFIGAGGVANTPTARFTPGLPRSLIKILFNIADREIFPKWLFSGRLCSTSGFGELAPGRLVISLALGMKGCRGLFLEAVDKKKKKRIRERMDAGKRRARFGSVQLADVLQVTARGGRSTCRRMLGDAREMLEGLGTGEMLTLHFPPAPRSRPPASRSKCLYPRLDPKTNSNQPRQIPRAIPGGSEAADHYCWASRPPEPCPSFTSASLPFSVIYGRRQ